MGILRNLLCIVAFVISIGSTSAAQSLVWHQTNGPYGGNTSAVATNNTTVFAGLKYGGLYRSTNQGDYWLPADGGLPANAPITALAASGGLVFAGSDSGIFRSTNDGLSWIKMDTAPSIGPGGGITSIACNGALIVMVSGSVFCSTDSGQTWNLSLNRYIAGPARIMGSVILAGTYVDTPIDNGIWRSSDSGKTWRQTGDGVMHPEMIITGISPSGTYVYATGIGGGAYRGGGLYRSQDTGSSWSVVDTSDFFPGADNLVALGSIIVISVRGHHVAYRSVDSGHTWEKVNALQNPGPLEFQTQGTDVYASTEGGIFRSSDSGATWVRVDSGIIASDVDAFAVDSSGVYAGAYGGGVYHFNAALGSWSQIGGALVNSYVLSLARANRSLFAGMGVGALPGDYMFKNDLDSMQWDSVSDISCQSTPDVILSLTVDGHKMFAGDICGIEYSTDWGKTWKLVDSSGDAFSVSADGPEGLASGSQGVRVSLDSGKTWASHQLIFGYVSEDGGVAVHDGQFFAAFGEIYRSIDSGATWVTLDSGLRRGAAVLASHGSAIFAGGRGVYLSTDDGDYWIQEDSGLNDLPVSSLAIKGDTLFAGTKTGGVYWTDISSLPSSVAPVPIANPLQALLTPNPVSNTATFRFELSQPQPVSIRIFDPVGREVWHSFRELPAGMPSLEFDARELAAGAYFYEVRAGSAVANGTMVVAR